MSTEQDIPIPEAEQEQEDEEEGPPPGFGCINPHPQPHHKEVDEADECPPPGWSALPNQETPHSNSPSDVEMRFNQEDLDDENAGGPPGWESATPVQQLQEPPSTPPSATLTSSNINVESSQENADDIDDDPPPGWSVALREQSAPHTAALTPPPSKNPPVQSKLQAIAEESDGKPSLPQSTTGPMQSMDLAPPLPLSSSASDVGGKQDDLQDQGEMPHPGMDNELSFQLPSGMGQLVCGTCRKLLSYPLGAKYVKCPCCQTDNLVLEAHEVGQVKCGGCAVLLMYPYGAPAVRCSSCRFVTKIGAHNRRPPLSEQQAQVQRPCSRAC